MKKTYEAPVLEEVALLSADIICLSTTPTLGFDNLINIDDFDIL